MVAARSRAPVSLDGPELECHMNRRTLLLATAAATAAASGLGLLPRRLRAESGTGARLEMIKDPNCGCCGQHAEYLRQHGYVVDVRESAEPEALRTELGVPPDLAGCHVILAQGYVIEGHVPAAAVAKLLNERPMIKGISVPGMPPGSPGMDGLKTEPLDVFVIQDGAPRLFMTE